MFIDALYKRTKRIHTSRFDSPYNTNFYLSTVLLKLSKRTQLRDCLKTKQHSLTQMFFCVDITLRPEQGEIINMLW